VRLVWRRVAPPLVNNQAHALLPFAVSGLFGGLFLWQKAQDESCALILLSVVKFQRLSTFLCPDDDVAAFVIVPIVAFVTAARERVFCAVIIACGACEGIVARTD